MRATSIFLALAALASLRSVVEAASNVTRLPASAFALAPVDRWSPRAIPGETIFLSKWGGATAIASSPVNETSAPIAIGFLYGVGSSNGYARVSVNGQIITELDTYGSTMNYTSELLVELKRPLPNLPLWVVVVEATGRWQAGSKDSFIEIVGLNLYH